MVDAKVLAGLLMQAREKQIPVPNTYKEGLSISDAVEIQRELTRQMVAKGARVIGKKVGFTGKSMRETFHMPGPDYGSLFDVECFSQGTPLDSSRFIYPRVEGEIAFLLKKDLAGPGVNIYDVLDATQGVMACLEFVDSHWETTDFTPGGGVADNGGCGGFMLGSKMLPLADLDLRYIAMFMHKNGELVNSGAGVEVMGDPMNAVAWLANKLYERGDPHLKAGDIVLSGAITPAVPVQKGDNMTISFSRLGSIDVKFI
jgi:2-keto-4-pentenoate hydratase